MKLLKNLRIIVWYSFFFLVDASTSTSMSFNTQISGATAADSSEKKFISKSLWTCIFVHFVYFISLLIYATCTANLNSVFDEN